MSEANLKRAKEDRKPNVPESSGNTPAESFKRKIVLGLTVDELEYVMRCVKTDLEKKKASRARYREQQNQMGKQPKGKAKPLFEINWRQLVVDNAEVMEMVYNLVFPPLEQLADLRIQW
jgi:hypothetical protein